MKIVINFIIIIMFSCISYSQTIEQRLEIVQNDQVLGGNFNIIVEVKGTSLPAANTLGSATIDINFDNTKLTYVNATSWAFGGALGYSRSATNNTTFIRVGVTGGAVNENEGGDPPGYDIGSSYATWVQLNFTIASSSGILSIAIGTNQIGLFENHSNEPKTAVINNQILTAPDNIGDTPLPIELTAFSAKQSGSKIDLTWQTKTEVHNYGFNVERKISSQNLAKGSEWQKIGFVPGNGSSNSPKEYSFIDNNPVGGKMVYRLKQLDTDGKFTYSDEQEVNIIPTEYKVYQNYPNPFNPSTTINFELPENNLVSLKVYDILGKEVATLLNEEKTAGYYNIQFSALGLDLSSGIYIYQLRAGNFVQTKKMILQK